MNRAGVWSFRTTTGVARVVNGSLRTHTTLRGFVVGSYRRLGSGSVLRHVLVGVGTFGAVGPIQDLVENVLAEGIVAGAVSTGLAALLVTIGTAVMASIPVWSLLGQSAVVDIYDITEVTLDSQDCELTIQYDDGGDTETATVDVYDDEELAEAVDVLRLKGAPVSQ